MTTPTPLWPEVPEMTPSAAAIRAEEPVTPESCCSGEQCGEVPKSGVRIASILLRLPSVQERFTAFHNPVQALLRPIVISLRRPTSALLPYKGQQLGPVVVDLVPDVTSAPHGVAGELELPCKGPYTRHHPGITVPKRYKVEALKRINCHLYGTRERPIIKVQELLLPEATSDLERLLELFADGWIAEEVRGPVRDTEHNLPILSGPAPRVRNHLLGRQTPASLRDVSQATILPVRLRGR
ncbi:hypothetical protein [Streptomyces decoyicus]|uniref:hypothetical protein n=1 Tax=Streptomyces decoyicus TaxID=249567 RepID=UPI0038697E8F